ncbi:MAG: tRNA (cytidine(34)-2'-O)-methyltransferase [bacterium]|nr:tRNA (cytidine(34)-2'-O)-methyltransferase [bacterium]
MAHLRIALYQPEIPQNTGTLLRLGACLGMAVDIIEPCGFAFSERRLKRAGMDYAARAEVQRHEDWEAFVEESKEAERRLVAVDTKGTSSLKDFIFSPKDVLLLGRESDGLPDQALADSECTLRIPMVPQFRSFNLAVSAAMVVGVALRQLNDFP